MSRLDDLISRYDHFVSLPWEQGLSGLQKVWFAVYDKEDERRLRLKVGEFELATKRRGHGWQVIDLTDTFAHWMAEHDYREDYFEEPDYLDNMALESFHQSICEQVREALKSPSADENTVVALQGVATLFGFTKVSGLIKGTGHQRPADGSWWPIGCWGI